MFRVVISARDFHRCILLAVAHLGQLHTADQGIVILQKQWIATLVAYKNYNY